MIEKSFLMLFIAVLFFAGCVDSESGRFCARQAAKTPDRVLRHVVLFQFIEGTTEAEIEAIENAFRALPGEIPEIYDFEWGTDVSVENKAQGYTHCFLVTFLNEGGREKYLPHPAHKAFGTMLRKHLQKVLVLDYWVQGR